MVFANRRWHRAPSVLIGLVALALSLALCLRAAAQVGLPDTLVVRIPEAVDRWDEQTSFRDQGERRTSPVFAAVAAMEAVYWREYGLPIDLSESYLFHVWKSGWLRRDYVYPPGPDAPPRPPYENQSCRWGGGSLEDLVAFLENYSIPLQRYCKYAGALAMRRGEKEMGLELGPGKATQAAIDTFEYRSGHIPQGAHALTTYGAKEVEYLPRDQVRNAVLLENLISTGHEVAVLCVPPEAGGVVHPVEGITEAHAMLLVGYDRKARIFVFKDSVKDSFRDDAAEDAEPEGRRTLTYDGFQELASEGLYIKSVRDPERDPRACFLGEWNMSHDGRRGRLVIRRLGAYVQGDGPHNFRPFTRLGTYYDGENKASDVIGSIEGNRMQFWIDFGVVNRYLQGINPSNVKGQSFTLYAYGRGRSAAREMAGVTEWQGKSYGVVATQAALPEKVSQRGPVAAPELKGIWMMTHDGWEGFLTIRTVAGRRIEGSYLPAGNGAPLEVKGEVQEHAVTFEIPFPGEPPQEFKGYVLSGDRDITAGTTLWRKKPFGFHAVKVQ